MAVSYCPKAVLSSEQSQIFTSQQLLLAPGPGIGTVWSGGWLFGILVVFTVIIAFWYLCICYL
jgi:hypothetical protein